MRTILSLAFLAGLALAGFSSTAAVASSSTPQIYGGHFIEARDGCGRGYHRNYRGHCVPNWDEERDWRWRHHHRHHHDW